MDQVRYFQPASDKTPNPRAWHAYRDASAEALCKEIRISYNRDNIADAVPEGRKLHAECQKALDKEAKA